MRPQILHFTIISLPLETQDKIDACKKMMAEIEPQIKDMIDKRGIKGRLMLEYDSNLGHFGSEENTKVIYLKPKEREFWTNPDQYDLLSDIIHILIDKSLSENLLEKHELGKTIKKEYKS